MLWFLLMGILAALFSATTDTQTLALEAGDGPVMLTYENPEASLLSVIAHSPEGDLDLTLEILSGTQRLAFNDDHQTADDSLSTQDSAIIDLPLPEAGDYQIRVHTFSGAQSGPVEITLISTPMIAPCLVDEALTLAAHSAYQCRLSLTANSSVTLSAIDHSGTLDPVLHLYAPQGELAAFNDDHPSADLGLNVLDAQIRHFSPASDGEYTLHISDFIGATGQVILRIEIDEQPE